MHFSRFEHEDLLFIAALLPFLAYGIGRVAHRNKRALHPDAEPEDWVQRGASRLIAKLKQFAKLKSNPDQTRSFTAAVLDCS